MKEDCLQYVRNRLCGIVIVNEILLIMPDVGTIGAVFILRRSHEEYHVK